MSTSQTNSTITVNASVNYWSLKPRVRDIEWSVQRQSWIAHLEDYQNDLKGSMEVCIDCVSVHAYHYCNGSVMRRFEACDMSRPVYSQ